MSSFVFCGFFLGGGIFALSQICSQFTANEAASIIFLYQQLVELNVYSTLIFALMCLC